MIGKSREDGSSLVVEHQQEQAYGGYQVSDHV